MAMALRMSFWKHRGLWFPSCKRSPCFSTASVLRRTFEGVKRDPFIKLSLSLGALIVGGTLIMELYKKLKRQKVSTMAILPPGFAHHSVKRQSLLVSICDQLKMLKSKSKLPAVLYITGPPGCGKTELVRQFCMDSHMQSTKKWFKLKPDLPAVISLNATSPKLLQLSIEEIAYNLGLPEESNLERTLSSVFNKLSSSQLPWLLVIDNLTEDTTSLFRTLLDKCLSPCHGSILVTTRCSFPEVHSIHLDR